MSPSSRNILITGGLGYVGGRTATYLLANSPETSLRLMTGPSRKQFPEWSAGLNLVKADLLDPRSLLSALDGIDTVIHLAAVNEIDSLREPDLALNINGIGTHRLLSACREKGIGRFIYFSTLHVYGPIAPQPITEQTPTRPIHPYAFTHRLAEDYVNWFQHSHGMETLILRLSNGYGYPADLQANRWTLVFNDLATQAVQKGEIRLRSGGGQHRDFVSLTDVARGVHHFLDMPLGGWGDGLFNFGGECSMSILAVAQRVASEYFQHTGKELPVILGEAEDSSSSVPVAFNVDKLKRTGFELTGNMSAEIRGTFTLCEQLETPSASGS